MRQRFAFGIVLLALVPASPSLAQMAIITPAQIGEIFCIGSLGNDMTPVEALLAPEAADLVARALAADAEFAADNPGEKPPLGDGLPWRTWPDYADGCTVTEVAVQPGMASVGISYSFSDTPAANYSNSLQLVAVQVVEGMPEYWRIADVTLGEGRSFTRDLRDLLYE